MSISNDQLYDTLLGIKGDIGALQATVESHKNVFETHVEADRRVAERVSKIELKLANHAGGSRVWALVAGAVGSVLGVAAAFWMKLHGG